MLGTILPLLLRSKRIKRLLSLGVKLVGGFAKWQVAYAAAKLAWEAIFSKKKHPRSFIIHFADQLLIPLPSG